MQLSRCVFLAALMYIASPCWADHPDAAHRPKGRAEDSLSGVYIGARSHHALLDEGGVYIEPMEAVLETLGRPERVVAVANSNGCESTYVWTSGAAYMEVGSGCLMQKVARKDVMRAHGAFAVEVWGRRAVGKIGVTGRGLALGDHWSKVIRLYGNQCECGRNNTTGPGWHHTHGMKYARYAEYVWDDQNVVLDIDADAQGRVVHILLMGDTE